MSYYELAAEEKEYYFFNWREVVWTTPHFHSGFEFLFVERGSQEVVIGGEKRRLTAGEGCFVDSFTVHSYEQGDSISYVLLGKKHFFERSFSAFGGKVPPRFFSFDNFALLNTLHTICSEPYASETARSVAFEGAMAILLAALAESAEFLPRRADKQSALVCDVLLYAEENLCEDLSLRAIAKKFGYSHEHLSRILNRTLCEHWNSYINRLRARKAHELLKGNDAATVWELACACGFDNPNTFYRAYKKEFGVPPRR